MCGLIGVIYYDPTDLKKDLLKRLDRLTYRGYDSSGIAFIKNSKISTYKTEGDISILKELIKDVDTISCVGIGHTRWATHGKPSQINSHPHGSDSISIVHNGIIENYIEIKESLENKGRLFESETDSEVIWHLMDNFIQSGKNYLEAFKLLSSKLKGTFAITVLIAPGIILATRNKSPLVFGRDSKKIWVASDPIVASKGDQYCYLEDGQIVELRNGRSYLYDKQDNYFEPIFQYVTEQDHTVDLGGFSHFMFKEIYDQVSTVENALTHYKNLTLVLKNKPKRILILGCGTSFYAGFIAKYWFESICRIPTEIDIASEFRYRDPVCRDFDLVILISQSGETADVIAAMDILKSHNIESIGVLNIVESSLGKLVDQVIPICAGKEIGVASTKAFMGQLCALQFLAHYFSNILEDFFNNKDLICQSISKVLSKASDIRKVSAFLLNKENFIFIGRGFNYPLALEGALKLKEISYINAQGYAAGEMKHGPIALVDSKTVIIAIIVNDHLIYKTISNIQEAVSRGGKPLVIVDEPVSGFVQKELPDAILITVPSLEVHLMPFICIVPLQLIAYYVALFRGCSIDRPRNLAKSVTVE